MPRDQTGDDDGVIFFGTENSGPNMVRWSLTRILLFHNFHIGLDRCDRDRCCDRGRLGRPSRQSR